MTMLTTFAKVCGLWRAGDSKSIVTKRISGKAFCLCDIQLNQPEVRIGPSTP